MDRLFPMGQELLPRPLRTNKQGSLVIGAPSGGNMRLLAVLGFSGLVLLASSVAFAKPSPSPADDHGSIVIVFKDGHRQSFASTEISRIDFKTPAVFFKDGHEEKISTADISRIEFEPSEGTVGTLGRGHFIGKWEVGQGNGSNFFITLDADGDARKTLGAAHGTWTVVNGEARISWDDGWHDVIRKVGTTHEKVAYEPGKSYDDAPANVTAARNTQPKPI
jgi:hypothetical protein